MDWDCDFVEVVFADADAATAAERHFPTFVANLGSSLAVRERDWAVLAEQVIARLDSVGLAYEVKASDLTEDDMWPVEPGDDEDDEPEAAAPRM